MVSILLARYIEFRAGTMGVCRIECNNSYVRRLHCYKGSEIETWVGNRAPSHNLRTGLAVVDDRSYYSGTKVPGTAHPAPSLPKVEGFQNGDITCVISEIQWLHLGLRWLRLKLAWLLLA